MTTEKDVHEIVAHLDKISFESTPKKSSKKMIKQERSVTEKDAREVADYLQNIPLQSKSTHNKGPKTIKDEKPQIDAREVANYLQNIPFQPKAKQEKGVVFQDSAGKFVKAIQQENILTLGTINLAGMDFKKCTEKMEALFNSCDLVVTYQNMYFVPLAKKFRDHKGFFCVSNNQNTIKSLENKTFKELCGNEEDGSRWAEFCGRGKPQNYDEVYESDEGVAIYYNPRRVKAIAKDLKENYHIIEKEGGMLAMRFKFLEPNMPFNVICAIDGPFGILDPIFNNIYVVDGDKQREEECLTKIESWCVMSSTGTMLYNPQKMMLVPRANKHICSFGFV